MKRPSIFILALLGTTLSCATFADTSVTLYGVADSGYGYERLEYKHAGAHSKASRSGLNDGYLKGSRWGLKGNETIGDDTQVIFALEQSFSMNTGASGKNGLAFDKKAILGLASETWGTVSVGRQKNVADDLFKVNTTKGMGKSKHAFGGAGVRRDKMIKYLTPNAFGLQAGVAYATNGSVNSGGDYTDRDYLISTGIRYSRNAFSLAAIYDTERANKKNGTRYDYRVNNWALAGTYDFDVVKIKLAYGQDRNGKMKKAGGVSADVLNGVVTGLGSYNTKGFKSTNYFAGLEAPLANGTLALSWSRSTSNLDDVYADDHKGQTISSKAQNIYAAMYQYPLSKRTNVYAYGSYGTGLGYIARLKGSEAGFGLNHRF